jgi:hypothetical protein
MRNFPIGIFFEEAHEEEEEEEEALHLQEVMKGRAEEADYHMF